jgi:hypothetical protein
VWQNKWLGLLILSVMALCSACVNLGNRVMPTPAPLVTSTLAATPAASPTSTLPVASPQSPNTGGGPTAAPGSADPAQAIVAAKTLLAEELDLAPDSVIVVSAIPVQWNDSSLGCPQDGQVYTQVVTPGYLVALSVDGQDYNVHTDLSGLAVLCTLEGDPVGPGTVPDPIVAEFIEQARFDLAGRLGIPSEEIVLVRSEAIEWPDSSLGCPLEDELYVQALTAGYRIVLAVGDVYYEYHTDQQRMILCETPTP